MMRRVEIYFRDLKKEAQDYILETCETTEKGENGDVFPLVILERENEWSYTGGDLSESLH